MLIRGRPGTTPRLFPILMLTHLLNRSIILTGMLGHLRHKSNISLNLNSIPRHIPDLHTFPTPMNTPMIADMAQRLPENVLLMMAQACLRIPRHLPYDEYRSISRFLAVLLTTAKPLALNVHILGRDVSQNPPSSMGKAMV